MERICPRCTRICFSEAEWANHECFDMADRIDAEIALAKDLAAAPTVEVWTRAQCMVCGRWEACRHYLQPQHTQPIAGKA